MNSTGDKLRALRDKHNMTAQELADKLGVTAPAISMWERNKREIDNSTLLRIATIFNVTTDYLLGAPAFKPTLSKHDELDIQKRLNTPEIGNRIKNLRKQYNMTQDELGYKITATKSMISLWENGKRKIDTTTLSKLAKIFNVSTDYLINGNNTNFKPTLSKRDELDIQKRLERLMNDLDSETGLAFYNGDEEIDDETRELLRASLESSLRITKLKAKEKFTPKKYRR